MHLIFTISTSTEINVIVDSSKCAHIQVQRLKLQKCGANARKIVISFHNNYNEAGTFLQSLVNYDKHVRLT